MSYHVGVQDWPASLGAAELSEDDIVDVLNGIDDYFEPAMESLRQTAAEGLAQLNEDAEAADNSSAFEVAEAAEEGG